MKTPNNTPFAYHTELEITIDNITNLGLGVGRHEGWVIMVPNVAIGERVRCRIFRNHCNYSEADLLEVLEPSPDRVEPRCPLFGLCGGCQYQHLKDETQRQLKRQHITELLQRLAGIECPVEPICCTPHTYHYRSKLTPHYDKSVSKIGFLKVGSRLALVDVPQCPIATEHINQRLLTLRSEIRARTHKRGGTLLLRDTPEGVMIDPQTVVTQMIGDKSFRVYAGEFFQNNPYILPQFVNYITHEAAGKGIDSLIDAYCGVGVFGICGHVLFQNVLGVEINARAIALAEENAALNHADNVHFIANSAEQIFHNTPFTSQTTAVIIDPPRKGCDTIFLEQLLEYAPQRIVYVSCAPDTQARDLKILLAHHYQVQRVQPFDLFPQTRHIENVITLDRVADGFFE
ncbi:MAG: class I SAM-dependent RNA methyltransferase [Verrucomicrobiota bacterium]|nr:MAG: class I SAM-dependent RNA methyltransferase [Verrucomicrobiota bacterium]